MRILQVMPTLGHGGISMMMKMYGKELEKYGVVFDYLHHGKPEDFHREIESTGSKIFCIPNLTKCGYLKYKQLLKKIIKENGPYDAMHINMNYMSGRYANIAHNTGIPKCIIHVHGNSFYKKYLKLLLPLFRYDIRKNGDVLCADSSTCGDYYYQTNPYHVIPVAIDTDIYDGLENKRNKVRAKFGLSENDFAIGHIAAFYEVKNHKFDVELLRALKDCRTDIIYKMIFAGDGPLKNSIEDNFRKAGLNNETVFLGNIDYIPEYLSAMDLTVLPSFSEGFGQVLVQSQMAGIPCIASDSLPRETDMHLGIIHYLPIEGSNAIDSWIESIQNIGRKRLDYATCKKGLDISGYSIDVAAKKLYELYKGSSNG